MIQNCTITQDFRGQTVEVTLNLRFTHEGFAQWSYLNRKALDNLGSGYQVRLVPKGACAKWEPLEEEELW